MYKVKVNSKTDFNIEVSNQEIKVNDSLVVLDEAILNEHSKHVIYNNKSYNLELVQLNREEKTAVIKVNGNIYSVSVKDQFDQLLKQLGMDNLSANKVQQIKAPMPGLVLQVLVVENQEVKKGDNLLVLEAMKMENMLKSPSDGIIKKILIQGGDKVEKNQILIQF
ncbi:MAG: acetyl-CoA carboxylase biotin carboxyl carrier protein subunit [Pedobacter sp.]|nr:MAG: acetyl-CoA carboxylase biotin carboxyl carrier protein subunit [Pedobacter sp.]